MSGRASSIECCPILAAGSAVMIQSQVYYKNASVTEPKPEPLNDNANHDDELVNSHSQASVVNFHRYDHDPSESKQGKCQKQWKKSSTPEHNYSLKPLDTVPRISPPPISKYLPRQSPAMFQNAVRPSIVRNESNSILQRKAHNQRMNNILAQAAQSSSPSVQISSGPTLLVINREPNARVVSCSYETGSSASSTTTLPSPSQASRYSHRQTPAMFQRAVSTNILHHKRTEQIGHAVSPTFYDHSLNLNRPIKPNHRPIIKSSCQPPGNKRCAVLQRPIPLTSHRVLTMPKFLVARRTHTKVTVANKPVVTTVIKPLSKLYCQQCDSAVRLGSDDDSNALTSHFAKRVRHVVTAHLPNATSSGLYGCSQCDYVTERRANGFHLSVKHQLRATLNIIDESNFLRYARMRSLFLDCFPEIELRVRPK